MGLVKKLVLWFSVVIILSFGVLYFVVAGILNANNEAMIAEAMEGYRDSCEAYITRYIMDAEQSTESDGLLTSMRGMSEEFSNILGCGVAIYDADGNYYQGTYADNGYVQDDVQYARDGLSAYSVVKEPYDTYAMFSFPVMMDGEVQAIIRLQADYTGIYANSEYVLEMILLSCLGILCVAILLLALYMGWVINPVNKLSAAIERVSENPYEAEPLNVKRHDEIGRLTDSYNHMSRTIREQWNTIQLEKENLKKTIQYRKDFYDNITHELKTPLTIILGYAEMMKQTDFQDEEFNNKGIEQVIIEAKRLCNMVAGLLEASRATDQVEAQFEQTRIDKLLEDIVSSMRVKANRYAARIEAEIEEGLTVLGKPEELRKLFVNLIDNAIKYGEPGDPVTVRARADGQEVSICVENQIEENSIRQEDFDKIFLPFYRSRDEEKKEAGSVGLGLAICRNIVDDHGGSIAAEMPRSDRISFQVTLPAMADAGEERAVHGKRKKD